MEPTDLLRFHLLAIVPAAPPAPIPSFGVRIHPSSRPVDPFRSPSPSVSRGSERVHRNGPGFEPGNGSERTQRSSHPTDGPGEGEGRALSPPPPLRVSLSDPRRRRGRRASSILDHRRTASAGCLPKEEMQATKAMHARSSAFFGTGTKRTATCRAAASRSVRVLEVRASGKEAAVGLYGTKAGMTQVFTRKGNALPVTVISLGEGTFVTQVSRTRRKKGGAIWMPATYDREG